MSNQTAAVITVSDRSFAGEREDKSGPALCDYLSQNGWQVVKTLLVPDEKEQIAAALCQCTDELGAGLVLTTGGTGFAPRDITPEAANTVIERQAPGLAELMRAESMKITQRACLSRGVAGLRGNSIILTLPGSPKAALENLSAVLPSLLHGLVMLRGSAPANCASEQNGRRATVLAVCISEKKGEQKHAVDCIRLKIDHGIEGDAHAGNWHRQVSLLSRESVKKVEQQANMQLAAGAFAENILTDEGLCLYKLPVGTRLSIGSAACEVTQIGKECHAACVIREKAGDCVMPREGIFVKVLVEGEVRAGDSVLVLED